MKQIILPSTVPEFTWLVIHGFGRKWLKPPFPKKEIRSPLQKVPKFLARNLKSSQPLATKAQKKLVPHKKIFVGRGEYIYNGK